MFFAKIPRHTRQNAITEGDLECILTRNCEGTEQLRKINTEHMKNSPSRHGEELFSLKRGNPIYRLFTVFKLFQRLSILKSLESFFAGTDLNDVLDIVYKYFTITVLTCMKCFLSCLNNSSYRNKADYDFNLNLWQ